MERPFYSPASCSVLNRNYFSLHLRKRKWWSCVTPEKTLFKMMKLSFPLDSRNRNDGESRDRKGCPLVRVHLSLPYTTQPTSCGTPGSCVCLSSPMYIMYKRILHRELLYFTEIINKLQCFYLKGISAHAPLI